MKTDFSHGGECLIGHRGVPGYFITEGHTCELVWRRLDKAESQSPDLAEALSTSPWLPQMRLLFHVGVLTGPASGSMPGLQRKPDKSIKTGPD